MRAPTTKPEVHLSHRSNWLRAAVLGANDGILSTSSLILGVAAAGASRSASVTAGIAGLVAAELTARDALQAHARDELGLAADRLARPLQAASASALSFSAGAALPLLAVALATASTRVTATVLVTLLALALLGDAGARLGGAPRGPATVRVVLWGAVAMAVTAAIGALVGTVA